MLGVCNGEDELRFPVRSTCRPPPGFRPVPLTFALRLICMLTALPSYVHEPSRSEQVCSPNGQLVRSNSQNTRYLAGGIQCTVPSDRTTQLVLPYASSWCPSALWKTRRARDVRRSRTTPRGLYWGIGGNGGLAPEVSGLFRGGGLRRVRATTPVGRAVRCTLRGPTVDGGFFCFKLFRLKRRTISKTK